MTTYPQLFDGEGVKCYGCKERIILPIDLRRDCGINYHGKCFTSSIDSKLKQGKFTDKLLLEHHLRVLRLCTHSHPDASPLSEVTLDMLEINNRQRLEKFYWKNETPVV